MFQADRAERIRQEYQEAVRQEDWPRALAAAGQAYVLDKTNAAIWRELAELCEKLGMYAAAGFWRGLIYKRDQTLFPLPEDPQAQKEFLFGAGYGISNTPVAPYHKEFYRDGNMLKIRMSVAVGECLPEETNGKAGYWTGIYNPQNAHNICGRLVDAYRQSGFPICDYNDMIYDLLRAQPARDVTLSPDAGECYIQPIGGGETNQKVLLSTKDIDRGEINLGKYEVSLLRVEEPLRIASEQTFWLGEPILLGHHPKRRKVVLNILADGLSWNEQKKEDCKNIPNIMRFFSKGLIFDEAYSASEYTYPSLTTIETGLQPTTSRIFNNDEIARLEPGRKTLSEQMKDLGYYCVNVMGDGSCIYNGATRGYDRMIVNHIQFPAYQGVERTIEQLEAFGEADQFLFLHISDSHPYNKDIKCRESVQTKLHPGDIIDIENNTSVFMMANQRNQVLNRTCIHDMDRYLGVLFTYLETHYQDDEILVSLYSDHGCSIYSDQPWLLSKMHGNTALMLRGGGVPCGVHSSELVSTTDIYALLGHYAGFAFDKAQTDANLPEVCGGNRRSMTVSHSIFPGQTRKICLRTETYACRFETEHFTETDGSVLADPYRIHVFLRENDEQEEVFDPAVLDRFQAYIEEHAQEWMLKGFKRKRG